MRLPQPTTRRLMAMVAVAALPLVLFAEIRRRQDSYARLADVHRQGWDNNRTRAVLSRGQCAIHHAKAGQARKFSLIALSVASGKPKTITVNGVEIRWREDAEAHLQD